MKDRHNSYLFSSSFELPCHKQQNKYLLQSHIEHMGC